MKMRLIAVCGVALGLAITLALITNVQGLETHTTSATHQGKLPTERSLQPIGDLTGSRYTVDIAPTLSITHYLPLVSNLPSGLSPVLDCDNVVIDFFPSESTYNAGDHVDVTVTGVEPAHGTAWLQWTRSSANTQLDDAVWTVLDVEWNSLQSQYEADWIITDMLPGSSPYDESRNQEFIVAFTLWDDKEDRFLCVGNPDPGVVAGHPELPDAMCENCSKVLVTRDEPSGSTTSLEDYWNVEAGYSFTYLGDRLDETEDDNGMPVVATFVTRLEYEMPVRLCSDVSLIPQRWTKSNRWGYWGACAAKPQDRDGSIWTEGNRDVRFFLSDARYSYTWVDDLRGAYAHKIYEVENHNYALGYLDDTTLNRTIVHTSHNHENHYYPPYLLSYAEVPDSGQDRFARIDSIYHYHATDLPDDICQTQTPMEDHNWYTRHRFLTDDDLWDEFSTIQSYFSPTKDIVVLSFFEGGDYSDGRPILREDWYLMKDVGLVGVDQAKWDKDDTSTASIYLDATYMKEGTLAEPHVRIRADRGYIGSPLEITAIAPDTSFPMTVAAGSCYTIAVHSTMSNPMPYDGRMEHDGGTLPSLWLRAVDDKPHWADRGLVVECLPADFPPGEHMVRLRPYVARSPSANETALSYTEMPWSTNYLWIVVP